MKRSLKRIALALLAVVTPCLGWGAEDITEVIAINFGSELDTSNSTTALGYVSSDGTKGAQVALNKWNNVSGANGTGVSVKGAMIENATYSLTFSSPNTWNSGVDKTDVIGQLTYTYLDVSNAGGGVPNITLTGMPVTGYDVAVILSGDGGTFGGVTVNGTTYIGDVDNATTIAGNASWGTRAGNTTTLAEGTNVIYVSAQRATTLSITGLATSNTARSSIAGLMVFFREIPSSKATISGATQASAISWDPALSQELDAMLTASADATVEMNESIEVAGFITQGSSIIFTAPEENAGTLTASSATINADTDVSGITASLGDTTIAAGKTLKIKNVGSVGTVTSGEGSVAYYTDAVSLSGFPTNKGATLRYKDLTTTGYHAVSGITILIGEGDKATLHTRQGYNFILDGGDVATTQTGEFWLGGNGSSVTVNSGVMDLTTLTSDSGTAAGLFYYTGSGGPVTINGGIVDAANTSFVGWGGSTTLTIKDGFFRTKGLRGNGYSQFHIDGGIVELGATGLVKGNMANVQTAYAPRMTGTIRAIDNTTVSINFDSTANTGCFQAKEGKTLTIADNYFKGSSAAGYTIGADGGTAKTQTRTDVCTYNESDINVTGTVKLSGNTFENATTLTVKSGTLDMTAYAEAPANLTITLAGGTLKTNAGAEGTITVPAGSTLQLVLSEAQLATEYTATNVTIDGGTLSFVDSEGKTVSDGVDGTSYKCPVPAWTPVAADSQWSDTTLWSVEEIPTTGSVIINAVEATYDVTATIPSGSAFEAIEVAGTKSYVTTLAFTDEITSAVTITIKGHVALADEVIANENVTLVKTTGSSLVADVTFSKEGAPTKATPSDATTETDADTDGAIAYGIRESFFWGDTDVRVKLDSDSETAKMVFGGLPYGNTTTLSRDIWMNIVGGSYSTIAGGNNANAWGASANSHVNGDIVVEMTGGTANYILGGHWKDGNNNKADPSISGDITVVIGGDAVINGSVFGGCLTAHNNGTIIGSAEDPAEVTVLVKNVQTAGTASNDLALKPNYIGGGDVYMSNANPQSVINGNTTVAVDLTNADLTDTIFAKSLVGGSTLEAGGSSRGTPKLSVTGNTAVTVTAPADVTFSGNIYGGSYINGSGEAAIGGNTSVTLDGGIYTGMIVAASSGTSGSAATTGAATLTLKSGIFSGAKLYPVEGTATVGSSALTISGDIDLSSATVGNFDTLTVDAEKTLTLAAGATFDTVALNGALTIAVDAEAKDGATLLTCAAADIDTAKITITGIDGATAAKNADNTAIILVLPVTDVCEINGQGYSTLAEALAEAEDGDTIVLVADAELTADATLPAGVTIQTDDYTISGADTYLKDIAGNVVAVGEDGSYVAPTYEVTVIDQYNSTTTYQKRFVDAVKAAGDGYIVTLQTSVSVNETITVDSQGAAWYFGVAIDLNGNTITSSADTLFYVKQGLLAVEDGTIETSGVAFQVSTKNTAGAASAYAFDDADPWDRGQAYLSLGDDLEVTSTGDNCILVYNGAKVASAATLETESDTWAAIQGTGLVGNPTRIELTGGSVTAVNHAIYHPQDGRLGIGTDQDKVTIVGATGIEMRAGTLNVVNADITATGAYEGPKANGNGSTVTGAAIVLSQHTTGVDITAAITGGTVTATGTDGKTLVVANTTTADPVSIFAGITSGVMDIDAVEILVDSLMLVETENGNYTTTAVVATIDGTKYASLPLAFAAANENETADTIEITIAAGAFIELDAAIEVTTKVTLNLNNAIIHMTEEDTDGNGVFYVTYGGDLTINGEGTIAAVGNNDYCMAVWADGGKVTINGGTYNNLMTDEEAAAKKDPTHFDLIYVKNEGEIVITGGHFVCQTPAWTLNSHDSLTGTITVTGGTFVEYDPANITTEPKSSGITSWVADGYYTYADEVTKGETTATWYYVEKATVPETMEGLTENFSDAAKDALIDAAVEAKTSITSVVAGDGQDAATIDAALALFDGIVTVNEEGKATVDWDFGISDIKVNRNEDGSLAGTVDIKATVQKGEDPADYADNVKVIFTIGNDKFEITDGTATLTVDIEAINGKEIKVKASK